MQERAQKQEADSEELHREWVDIAERGKAELAAEQEKQSAEQTKGFALLALFLIIALVSCFLTTWWVRLLLLLLSSSLPVYAIVQAVRRERRHWRNIIALAEALAMWAEAAWNAERVAQQMARQADDAIEVARGLNQRAEEAVRAVEQAHEQTQQAIELTQEVIGVPGERGGIIHDLFEVIQRTTGAPISEWLATGELEDYRDIVTKLGESEELLRERLQSLLVQIENLKRNQMLIEEQMTKFVLPIERPLQLIEELRKTEKELEDRKRRLDKLMGKLG